TIVDEGSPLNVLEHYNAVIARKKADSDYLVIEEGRTGRGRGPRPFGAPVREGEVLGGRGEARRAVVAGPQATIRIRVFFFEPVRAPTVGVLIRDRLGNEVWGTNTELWRLTSGDWQPGETLELRVRAKLPLGAGDYSVTAAVHTGEVHLF